MINRQGQKGNKVTIITKDEYMVRGWEENAFNTIIDIGANLGFFSVFMRMRHPNTKIIAVEPSIEACRYLKQNINMLEIILEEKALGNGKILYMKDNNHILATTFVEDKINSYRVKSISLSDLMIKYECKFPYMIKINCEGGEKFLIGDSDSEDILKEALQFSLQIHFRSPTNNMNEWIEWEKYRDWVNNTFTNHSIKYYKSRKKKGIGYYCIRKLT